MAAIVHDLTEPLPAALAVDSSVLFAAIGIPNPYHDRAQRLLRRLHAAGAVVGFCPELVALELWATCAKLINGADQRTLEDLVRRAEEAVTGQRSLPIRVLPPRDMVGRRRFVVQAFERLLDRQIAAQRAALLPLTSHLLRSGRSLVIAHGLRSHDATHLAVSVELARHAGGVMHLATLDRDFAKIDGLNLWGLPRPGSG